VVSKARWVLGLLVLSGSPCALAQIEPGEIAKSYFVFFHEHVLFPFAPVYNLRGTTGSSFSPPPRVPEIPQLPESEAEKARIKVLNAGHTQTSGDLVIVTGGAKVLYRGYTMTANKITANRKTEVFIGEGNAHLSGSDANIYARKILVDYNNKTYQAFDSDSDIKPSLGGGILLSDLYAKVAEDNGNQKESYLRDSVVTTCSYPDPHYYLKSRYVDLRYGRRAVFRDLDIYLLHHRLIHLPFLVIPLDDMSYHNLPEVGEDPVEGYFIKTHYGIPLKGSNSLFTRFDYFTRLGLGVGTTYSYLHDVKKDGYGGDISLYGVTGAKSFVFNEDDTSSFGWATFKTTNSIQNHDYNTAPTSVIVQNQFSLLVPQRGGTSALNYSRNDNSSAGFDSLIQTLSLNNSFNWNRNIRTTFYSTYSDSNSSYVTNGTTTNTDRKTIDVNFQGTDDLKVATATLEYQRTIPVGTITNFYTGIERVPELKLASDSGKLFGQKFGEELPFQLSTSIGQFSDPNSGGFLTRDFFRFSGNKQFSDKAGKSQLGFTSQFTQGLYSDNTAQYSLGLGTNYHYRLGKDTSLNFNYNYLRPEGFSPLGIDAVGKQNLFTADVSVRPIKPFLIGFQSGYDAIQIEQHETPYQPVGIRMEYSPHTWLLARSTAVYDPFIHSWSNIRLDVSYKPGATFIGFGARYDATRHTFADLNAYVQALRWGRSKIDLIATYDGFAKQFTSRQINITYDLHCAEAVFEIINNQYGFQSGTQFAFYLRLKAFPFNTGFGTGTRGQPIGIGTGVGY